METKVFDSWPFLFSLPFEDFLDEATIRYWIDGYWTLCFYISAAYLVAVYFGKRWMANRPAYNLRGRLVCWNLGLAIFSFIGVTRMLPELLARKSLYGSICYSGLKVYVKTTVREASASEVLEIFLPSVWGFFFVLSKVPELGDTAFIILRKRPLSFLHWYHHVTVLIFTWYSSSNYASLCRWFCTMNYSVHTAMYTYYALKAIGIRIPKPVSIIITLSQLAQMVVGCTVTILAYHYKQDGRHCETSYRNIWFAWAIYLSYLVLFAHFFYKAYLIRRDSSLNDGRRMANQDCNEKKKAI